MRRAHHGWRAIAGASEGASGGRRRDLFGLLVLALAARLPRLAESLWFDEAFYSTHERFASWQQLLDSLLRSIAAPLYRLLLFGWVELAGEHEVVVRLPSLLFGLGSIALTYELARRWFDLPTARLAAAWLVLSPPHVWYSQEATPYALVALLVVTAIWLAARCADETPTWAAASFVSAALGAAFFTHYLALAAALPLVVVALAAPARARRRLLAAVALVVIAAVVFVAVKQSAGRMRTSQGFLRPFDAFEAWMFYGQWCLHGNTLWPVSPYRATPAVLVDRPGLLALQVAAMVVLALGIRRALGDGARRRAAIAALFALPAAFWALTLAGYRHLYIERYAFWALPFFAVLAAHGALAFAGERARRVAVTLWLGIAAAAYVGWYLQDDRWTVYKQNSDWRAAAADLAAGSSREHPVLAIGVRPTLALRYHLRRIGALDSVVVIDGELPRAGRALRRGVRRFFVVEDLYWSGDVARPLAALDARPELRRAGVRDHRGVRLFEYVVRADDGAGPMSGPAQRSPRPPAAVR